MRTSHLVGLALASILFLPSCATRGAISTSVAPSEPIEANQTVSVRVKSALVPTPFCAVCSIATSTPVSEDAAARLRERLAAALVAEGVFADVLPPTTEAQYTLEISITEARQVGTGARVVAGVIAGRNKVAGSIRLLRSGSSASVREFTASGESASHPMAAEASLDDAVRVLAQNIIQGLKGQ